MKKLIKIDIKRLLQSRTSIIITIAAPLLLILLVSLTVAPLFFTAEDKGSIWIALYNQDAHERTSIIVDSVMNTDSFNGFAKIEQVNSEEEGFESIEKGAVAFVHIPKDMQVELGEGKNVAIYYYGNKNMPLENAMLVEILSPNLELVDFTQNITGTLSDNIEDKQLAGKVVSDASVTILTNVLIRAEAFKKTDDVSPMSGSLPIEYYAASLLILFIALGALPIAKMISAEVSSGLSSRQLLSGNSPFSCLFSKCMAGSLLLFVQFVVLSISLLAITGSFAFFEGNVLIMLLSGLVLCIFACVLMMTIGLYSSSPELVAFVSVFALALIGGLIVPVAYMPMVLRDVAQYTPFSAALRLTITSMFNSSEGDVLLSSGILAAFSILLFFLSQKRFIRRVS